MFGLDYTHGPTIAEMRAHNPPVEFACRYVGYFQGYDISHVDTPQGKVLTPSEARANSQAGIATVSNYEWTAERATEPASSGAWDAHTANAIHLACGGPADRPIYFSVDTDVSGTQVADYFRGVASAIGLARTGAYGSKRVLAYLFDNHLITWGWQTYAWSGGQWEPRAHIRQVQNNQKLAGADVDFDESMTADFGQWFAGGSIMGVPQGWVDDGHTLTATNGNHVVLGFRDWILTHPWDAANQPLGPEFYPPQVQLHNTSLGPGSVQLFRDNLLWYTSAHGVVQEPYLGLEIQACYSEIASLQQQLAQATKPDITALLASINNIGDAIAPAVAQALVEAKKL